MRAILWSTLLLTLMGPMSWSQDLIWDTLNQKSYTLEEFVDQRQPGEILVLGEEHATKDNQNDPIILRQHQNQTLILRLLSDRKKGTPINTGMEFLPYTEQSAVDRFLEGSLLEDYFLKAVGWSLMTPFDMYRAQVLSPLRSGGRTLALNIPHSISSQVAKKGPASLSEKDFNLLPPIWERGLEKYYERFQNVMRDHATPEQIDNFFWAQSLWDDTMAWNAKRYTSADAITLVIVGDFHVEFGHGLPSRLLRYGADNVTTLLQVDATDAKTPEDLKRLTAPDVKYGVRADYLLLNVTENLLKKGPM